MFVICFYVPKENVDSVKHAMFEKGAGRIGHYSGCAWQVLGEGQFTPLEGSHPAIGQQNIVEKVMEYKVEMVCEEEYLTEVIAALKSAHPYEQPAYYVWRTETI